MLVVTQTKTKPLVIGWLLSGDMKIMQLKTQTGQTLVNLEGHNGDVAALSLNPRDANTFVTGSVDR